MRFDEKNCEPIENATQICQKVPNMLKYVPQFLAIFAFAILVIIAMAFLIMWLLDIGIFKNENTQHRDHQKAPNLEPILIELSLV